MLPPTVIAYERAADVRVERTFERVLAPLLCADTDSEDALLTELLDSFSGDFAGLAELTVTATGTADPAA